MNLHLVDLVGQYKRIKTEIDTAIHRILDSGQFIMGAEVAAFEKNLASYLGVAHAIGCNSGTDALHLALRALDIGPGDEVITTPFTFAATVEAILLTGAKPVYVDIQPDSFNIDPDRLEEAVTERTRAILPVHLYGQPADMEEVMAFAQLHKLFVVEDAAQAIGAEYQGKKAGTFGHVGCISLFPSKNLGAFGDGGVMVTNDDELADKMRMLIVHGSRVRYYHEMIGFTSRLDGLQAAIVNVKLRYLDEWNAARRNFAQAYDQLLRDMSIVTPQTRKDRTHIFHQYTIRVNDRDGLAQHLQQNKIPFGIYYPVPLYRQKAFEKYFNSTRPFPVTEKATQEVISLPMHTELTPEMLSTISDAVKAFYR